jgi:hypothetical protein
VSFLNCRSQGRAGDSCGSSNSFGAEEVSMTKNMAEMTILGQSFINHLLVQKRAFRQCDLNRVLEFLKKINFHQNPCVRHLGKR